MKKYFLTGSAMLVLGGFLASCTHDDLDYSSIVENKKAAYQEVFVKTYGKIDPNQTWGFGSEAVAAARGVTRAVFSETWDGVHNSTSSSKVPCGVNWTDTIQFTIPSGLVTVDANTTIEPNKNYYVPSTFNGKVKFADNYNGSIYVAGKVTGYEGGNQQTVNIYIFDDASWTSSFTTGTATFYNNGYLTLGGSDLQNSNIAAIYNAGSFTYTGTNTNSSTYFYSTGTVELTADNVDFKLKSDIHNTMKAKNVKIQNSTAKYICGIEATGKVENVDGPLVTSNVIANKFSFDGNPIYLTQGGHINVDTLCVPNSNCHVYAVAGSTALVEATNFEFDNKNDFTHTFSPNIYFKFNSGYIEVKGCYGNSDGNYHKYTSVEEYIKNTFDEFDLAKDRINAGDASGSPACGQAWSIGNTDITIPTDQGETGGQIEVVTITKKFETIKLHDAGRVFCEDLGQISTNDLDFNDVVFDAYIYEVTPSTQTIVKENDVEVSNTTTVDSESTYYKAAIVLLAAGGTLQLSVAGIEVHNALGGNPISTIINTITSADEAYNNTWVTNAPVILGEDFDYPSIADIPIVVLYGNGEKLELTAEQGWAPHKIRVPIGTKWCKERVDIATAYFDFNNYVNSSKDFWEEGANINEERLYPSEVTYTLSTKEETKLVSEKEETTYRSDEGSATGGYQNGEPVLSRELR